MPVQVVVGAQAHGILNVLGVELTYPVSSLRPSKVLLEKLSAHPLELIRSCGVSEAVTDLPQSNIESLLCQGCCVNKVSR